MIYIKQDKKYNCGQTCVAMVAEKGIRYIESLFGHDGRSQLKETVTACEKLGIKIGGKIELQEFIEHKGWFHKLPPSCFVSVRCYKGKNFTHHRIVRYKGRFYDPSGTEFNILPPSMKVVAHLRIKDVYPQTVKSNTL